MQMHECCGTTLASTQVTMLRSLATVLVLAALGGCATTGPSTTTHAAANASPRTTPAAPPSPALLSEPPRPGVGSPTAGDYRVAARDQLAVQVHGQDDISRTVRVSENGMITLPLVGE